MATSCSRCSRWFEELFRIVEHLGIDDELDQSPAAVLERIWLHLSEDAEFLLKGRVRIIKYEQSTDS